MFHDMRGLFYLLTTNCRYIIILVTKHYKQHKETAREIITKLVQRFASIYGVKIGRVSVRNQKTRWGSCSKLGNLNFNYKLIFLPEDLRNYIVIHEICHLIEFNHSKKFWAYVENTTSNYKELRRRLRNTRISNVDHTNK